MRAKQYLLAIVASMAALTTSLAFAPSASAVPAITVTNTGGVPKFGASKCEYSLQFEKCQLTVTNGSPFPVFITAIEIAGTNGPTRYGIINVQCKKNMEIASGKSCTDEVILNVFAVAGWSNWYYIQVAELGNPGNTGSANAYLTTI